MKVTFDHVQPIANNIFTFWFSTPAMPHYKAGQFIELVVPHDNKDDRGEKRWFTLSSAPTEPLLAITTKFATDNGSSFKAALRKLEPGAELNMASPIGDFTLPKDAANRLVMIAGGIGSTPYRSMVKYLQDSGEQRPVTLLYTANTAADVAFHDIFDKLGDNLKTVIGEQLTAKKILELTGHDDNQTYYISGPEPMVEALGDGLKAAGVNKKLVKADYFPGYTAI